MTHRGTGWLVDPFDSRDQDAEGVLFGAGAAYAREVNLYELVVADPRYEAMHDQGDSSSCVGWSFSDVLCLGKGIHHGAYYFAAPRVIYTNARRAPYIDAGSYPRLAAQGMREWGAPPETLQGAEFSERRINEPLAWHVLRAGAGGRIKNFYKVLGYGPSLVENLYRALTAKHPITFGQGVDRAFNDYKGGVLGKFSGASSGGHMTFAYGFDADGNFLCKNQSWPNWGEKGGALRRELGFYRMSPERMMERHVSDHYAFSPMLVAASPDHLPVASDDDDDVAALDSPGLDEDA